LASTVNHLKHTPRGDFADMLLHHVATIFLYLFSHMMNFGNAGLLISFLHDFSDMFVPIVKALNETIYSNLAIVFFLGVMIKWAFFRLYVFPQIIYYGTQGQYAPKCYLPEKDDFLLFFTVFLCALQVLHIFWYTLFINIIKGVLMTGKAENKVCEDNFSSSEANDSDATKKIKSM